MILIDTITGRLGNVNDFAINALGQRYYLIQQASDSLIINGQFFQLPPPSPIPGSPDYNGRYYFFSVKGIEVPFLRNHRGSSLAQTDSSILVTVTFNADTLFVADTFFVNQSSGNGSNLALLEYGFEGQPIRQKHWASNQNCFLGINRAIVSDGKIYACGEYECNMGGLLLDDKFLEQKSGNGSAFIGQLNTDLYAENLKGILGDNTLYNTVLTMNGNKKLLLAGASMSSKIHFCEDSLWNQAIVHWGTSFLYYIQFDSQLQCLNHKTIKYLYGSVHPTAVLALENNGYVIAGAYYASYIAFDSLYLHSPPGQSDSRIGYLAKLSENLDAERVFQLEGSIGVKTIEDAINDGQGNIWICGYTSSDTLRVGNKALIASPTQAHFGYLARLDADFNVLSLLKVGGVGNKLVKGQDGNIYFMIRYAPNDYAIYKLPKVVSDLDAPLANSQAAEIKLFPNPLSKERLLHFELMEPAGSVVEQITAFDVLGRPALQVWPGSKSGTVQLKAESKGLLFLEFRTSKGLRMVKKVVLE